MSTIEWFYQSPDCSVCGYQEMTFSDRNVNPAVIQLEKPIEIQLIKTEFQHQLFVAITIEEFDKLVIAWCKKRKLYGAFWGPVNKSLIVLIVNFDS